MALKCSNCRSGDCAAGLGDNVSCWNCGESSEAVPHGQAGDVSHTDDVGTPAEGD